MDLIRPSPYVHSVHRFLNVNYPKKGQWCVAKIWVGIMTQLACDRLRGQQGYTDGLVYAGCKPFLF